LGEQTLPIRREIPHLHQEFVARGEASRGVLQNSARAARGGGGGVLPRRMGRDVTRWRCAGGEGGRWVLEKAE